MTTNTFALLEQRHVPALQAMASVYQHAATGARHLHLATEEPELGFLVGFPTLPDSDDGRAHILEHTVLCGSQRYPVRDPFFAMMQRSVASFMNAMTYADRTVYPFATTDRADFVNLLDVYLDAVFFPRLDRMSFQQEGWRAELHEGRLALHGVVFNEMKHSYAQPGRLLYSGINRLLFAGTTYGVDSGGDPLVIPSLSHETLLAFHARHYHPAQAVFMSSGPVEPGLVQSLIEQRVMVRYSGRQPRALPALAEPWSGPRQAVVKLPAGAGGGAEEHGLQLAWRFGGVATVDQKLRLSALMQLLAGHDAAPVQQAIRAFGSGRPSYMTGPDFSSRQAVLHLGVSGLRATQIQGAQQALMGALQTVAREGLPREALDGVLRQLRFGERQQMPGYQRLVAAADAGLRGESLIDAIDREPALARLAEQMRDPGFLQREVQQLLACPNQLQVHVQPDERFAADRDAREQALVAAYEKTLDAAARQALAADADARVAHESALAHGVDLLPRIRPGDLSRLPRPLMPLHPDAQGNIAAPVATQGLSQADLVVDVSTLAVSDAPWLALLARILADLGAAGRPAAQALAWRETQVQEFRAGLQSRVRADGRLQVEFSLSASALREDQSALATVLGSWFQQPDLADTAHLRALVARDLQSQLAELPGRASDMVQLALLAPLDPKAAFDSHIDGLASLTFWGTIKPQLVTDAHFVPVQQRLLALLKRLQAAPRHWVAAAREDDVQALAAAMATRLPSAAAGSPDGATDDVVDRVVRVPEDDTMTGLALQVPVQVNSCGLAWPVPGYGSPQAPALAVAAQLLTQQFLHPAVRERGGAYGVHARYDGRAGVFSMRSVADPRLAGTYADFAQALQDVQREAISPDKVENAIVSVIKGLDRPALPLQQLHQGWEAWRRAAQEHERVQFRAGVLDCSLEAVRLAVAQCLDAASMRRAAVVAASLTEAELDGLRAVDLLQAAVKAGCMEPVEQTQQTQQTQQMEPMEPTEPTEPQHAPA